MTLNGQPGEPEANEGLQPEVQGGRDALTSEPTPTPNVPESVEEFRWGRDRVNVPSSLIDQVAEAFGTTKDAAKTWIQMGRDASNVYSDSRKQAADLARREAELQAKQQEIDRRVQQLETRSAAPGRPNLVDDPVGFWNNVASKIDKLDKVDRIDEIERMLSEQTRRLSEKERQESDAAAEREFVDEHARMADEWKRANLPYVDLQTIASTLDRFITEVPEGATVRDLLDMGYRIVTWDRVGKARAAAETRRLSEPRAKVTIPGASPGASAEGPPAGETLEQRRARLHQQVGGMTLGEWQGG